MQISLEDFNALAAEQSQRDVRIAQLEMELQQLRRRQAEELAALAAERDALWAEKERLQHQLELLQTDLENVRYENHWIKTYILLSVERVRDFFRHIHDLRTLATLKSFILEMLPADASPEQVAFARDAMQLPMTDDNYRTFNNYGTFNEINGKQNNDYDGD